MESEESKARLKRFEERMTKLKEVEALKEKLEVEKARTDYLKRTGRTEMKP